MCTLMAIFSAGLMEAAFAGEPAGQLGLSQDGRMHLIVNGAELCALTPLAADQGWKFCFSTATQAQDDNSSGFTIKVGNTEIAGEAKLVEKDGKGEASWNFTPKTEGAVNTLAVSMEFPIAVLGGGTYDCDGKKGTFPPAFGGTSGIGGGDVNSLGISFPDGRSLTLNFSKPASVGIQDNRQWGGQSYTVRISLSKGLNFRLKPGEKYSLNTTVGLSGAVACFKDRPVTLAANDEWVPLKDELEIEPDSALDLSKYGFIDGPCGSKGRVIATPEGHFAYASDPKTPRRFYGVNLCFTAQYLPKEKVDILLDRLVRLGYNTIRIHHYEFNLTSSPWKPGFDWDPARVDQLDYLIAGCAKRGIWITTDLYVSRPVPGKQIGLTGDKASNFKALVPVYEPAFQDWATFARKLLDHVNPYTGKRIAEEPALAWLSMINEGGGYDVKIPEWPAAWNRWLASRYPNREDLAAALGDLTDKEDPKAGTVVMPDNIKSGTLRARLCQVFLAENEKAMIERMKAIVRDELKCPALITDLNCGPYSVAMQATRNSTFDYVDDHFYVDHPGFLDKQWQLPSNCGNANPVREGAPGSSGCASLRVWGKPFTITEFNYSGPGRFRGVGGILTASMASLQDWDALWRFAYAHADKAIFEPMPIDYFNLANDPLNQAADRIATMIFLRRDVKTAPNRLEVVMPKETLRNLPEKLSINSTDWLAWNTRIGCAVVDDPAKVPANVIAIPVTDADNRQAVAKILGDRGVQTETEGVIRSETGEIVIDKKKGVLTIDTPCGAGGYADPGQEISARNAGVKVDGLSIGATVFVTSLDKNPIRKSTRLLVTHLTDLQNTGIKYSESARQNLYAWGTLPHLVRDGSATVRITLAEPSSYTVWALSPGGKRLEKIDAKVDAGELVFTAKIRGPDGARMLYEVAKK